MCPACGGTQLYSNIDSRGDDSNHSTVRIAPYVGVTFNLCDIQPVPNGNQSQSGNSGKFSLVQNFAELPQRPPEEIFVVLIFVPFAAWTMCMHVKFKFVNFSWFLFSLKSTDPRKP